MTIKVSFKDQKQMSSRDEAYEKRNDTALRGRQAPPLASHVVMQNIRKETRTNRSAAKAEYHVCYSHSSFFSLPCFPCFFSFLCLRFDDLHISYTFPLSFSLPFLHKAHLLSRSSCGAGLPL